LAADLLLGWSHVAAGKAMLTGRVGCRDGIGGIGSNETTRVEVVATASAPTTEGE